MKGFIMLLALMAFVFAFMLGCTFGRHDHIYIESEYKEAYLNCMKDLEKVREILKGDSLKTLLYW